jgi:hypothetical protein
MAVKKLDLSRLIDEADAVQNVNLRFQELAVELRASNPLGADAEDISKVARSLAGMLDNFIRKIRIAELTDERGHVATNRHIDNLPRKVTT